MTINSCYTLILTVLLNLFFCANVYAAQGQLLSESEFGQLLYRYQNFSTLKTHFVQLKTISGLNVELKSEGILSIRRPSHVVWQVVKPSPLTVSIKDNQVTMDSETFLLSSAPAKVTQKIALMISWLEMDAPALYKVFSISRLDHDVFQLTPRQKFADTAGVRSLVLTLSSLGYVKQIRIIELSGDTLDISFDKPAVS